MLFVAEACELTVDGTFNIVTVISVGLLLVGVYLIWSLVYQRV